MDYWYVKALDMFGHSNSKCSERQALHGAVKKGIPNVKDPKIADQAIQDCQEILNVIMEGKVQEWLN